MTTAAQARPADPATNYPFKHGRVAGTSQEVGGERPVSRRLEALSARERAAHD